MQIVTVGPKYQVVIPKEVRKKIKGLRPGSKVGIALKDENTVSIKIEPQSWVERNSGLMTKAWKGIDTTKYLKDLRNEWERKY